MDNTETTDATEREIINLKGKHIKNTLSRLERNGVISPLLRKVILDEFNDFARELLRYLGYTVID